jgi:regulator of protease activity HflC (stomatin/prohibitin superfamily)
MLFVLVIVLALFIVAIYLFIFRWSVNIPNYMAARHYRFGKPTSDKPISGKRCVIIPYIDQLIMIDQRIQRSTLDNIIVLTKERQNMQISAMIVWKSEDASMTIENIKPEDIQPTFFKIMESVIKNECAKMIVDEILENRMKLAHNLLSILKETADTWGLKISSVNISNLVVSNDKFMRNMALPKEIEIEQKASLAEIEKVLTIELKNIEKTTQSQLAGLKSEKIIGEEKERVASALEIAEKERISKLLEKDTEIEQLNAKITEIKANTATKTEADHIRAVFTAEADGLGKRNYTLAKYTSNALQYELINRLPEIYKNLKIDNLTLFHGENTEQLNEVNKAGYLIGSLISGFGKNTSAIDNNEKSKSHEINAIDEKEQNDENNQ